MTLWMEVTMDELELPVVIAGSADELARICHTNTNNIYSATSKMRRQKRKRSRFVKVEIEETDDENET